MRFLLGHFLQPVEVHLIGSFALQEIHHSACSLLPILVSVINLLGVQFLPSSIVSEIFTSVLTAHEYYCKLAKFQLLIEVCWEQQSFSIHLSAPSVQPILHFTGIEKIGLSCAYSAFLLCLAKVTSAKCSKKLSLQYGKMGWGENKGGLNEEQDGASAEILSVWWETLNLQWGAVAGCSDLWHRTQRRRESLLVENRWCVSSWKSFRWTAKVRRRRTSRTEKAEEEIPDGDK